MGEYKYIIMCGGQYNQWTTPRQLLTIGNETILERIIRLLRVYGVDDLAISSNNPVFERFGLPVLKHDNSYKANGYNDFTGYWVDAFYPVTEPTCYIFGDVVFSPQALSTIVETQTDDIELFASAPPFSEKFYKDSAEPFAFKVYNTKHFFEAIKDLKDYDQKKLFARKPIAWELWQVIKQTPLNCINYRNYTVINDYTCDIDDPEDAEKIKKMLGV